MGTFEDIFHITLFSNNSDILEIFAGTVLTMLLQVQAGTSKIELKAFYFFSTVLQISLHTIAYNNFFCLIFQLHTIN